MAPLSSCWFTYFLSLSCPPSFLFSFFFPFIPSFHPPSLSFPLLLFWCPISNPGRAGVPKPPYIHPWVRFIYVTENCQDWGLYCITYMYRMWKTQQVQLTSLVEVLCKEYTAVDAISIPSFKNAMSIPESTRKKKKAIVISSNAHK